LVNEIREKGGAAAIEEANKIKLRYGKFGSELILWGVWRKML
jgi:hypothetical protein